MAGRQKTKRLQTKPQQTKRQNVDEQANRLFFRFFQASNTLQTKSTQALDAFGITSTQWSVMGALSRPAAAAGMTISELSQYLLVSRQNLAGVLNRLEERGLVERAEGVEDRRQRTVSLSKAGEKLWLQLAQPISTFYEHALQGLSAGDRDAFVRSITLIQQNMAAH
jgi:MarR family transcriptional regulator, organic hydroperoxide resistance regulator